MKQWFATVLLLLLIFMIPSASLADNWYTVYKHGDPDSMKIAITVDDLYEPVNIKSILDLCLKYDIHITFFTLGIMIKPENAYLWQRMVDEGHEIGNHTYGHLNVTNMTDAMFVHQLTFTQEILNAALKEPYAMHLFRPPFGKYDKRGYGCIKKLEELNYPYIILWSAVLEDAQRSYKNIRGGDILLLHTNWQDVDCLETIVPQLLDAGYELVTVSELLELPPVEEAVAEK